MHKSINETKVLWTGGWDSTFLILKLLLLEKKVVAPYYLLDEGRGSLEFEMRTMKMIKEHILDKYPSTKSLFLPTTVYNVSDISPNLEISDSFYFLKEKFSIGSQYDWLARFCEQENIYGILLGVHFNDKFASVIRYNNSLNVHEGNDLNCSARTEKAIKQIIKYYNFPLLELTKKDIMNAARSYGFLEILKKTWFCFKPVDELPCGQCNPCKFVLNEGLGWRIPMKVRLKNNFVKMKKNSYQTLNRVYKIVNTHHLLTWW